MATMKLASAREVAAATAIRWPLLLLACLVNGLAGGTFLGWNGVTTMLASIRIYANECNDLDAAASAASVQGSSGGSGDGPCGAQYGAFNVLFIIATSCAAASPLLLGVVLDRRGPHACVTVGLTLVAAAAFVLAFGDAQHTAVYPVGFALLGLGGPGAQSGLMHLSNLFVGHEGLVLSTITAFFTLSFFVFQVGADFIGRTIPATVSPQTMTTYKEFFVSFGVVVLALAAACWVWVPRRKIGFSRRAAAPVLKPVATTDEEEDDPQRTGAEPGTDYGGAARSDNDSVASGGSHGDGATFSHLELKGQMTHPLFICMCAAMSVIVTSMNSYTGTMEEQVKAKLQPGDKPLSYYESAFQTIGALGGLVVPAFGIFVDVMAQYLGAGLVLLLGISFAAFSLLPLSLQFGTFVSWSALSACLFAFMYNYVGRRFGYRHYGLLTGIVNVCYGICNTFNIPLQSVLVEGHHVTHRQVNTVILISMTVLLLIFPALDHRLAWRSSAGKRRGMSLSGGLSWCCCRDADDERQSLL